MSIVSCRRGISGNALFDETAAYDRVAVVEDSRLSRCGGALWLVEGEKRRTVPGLPECSRCRRVAVAELARHRTGASGSVSGNRVQPGQRYGRRVQPVVRGQYNAAADRILGGNKHGAPSAMPSPLRCPTV